MTWLRVLNRKICYLNLVKNPYNFKGQNKKEEDMLLRDKARNPNYEPNKQLNHIHANKKLVQETELKHWTLSVNSIP